MSRERWNVVAIGGALAVVGGAYLLLARRFWFVVDDAFISFRFARNVAGGWGLRYNLGDHTPVEGYSNFLWVILAAIIESMDRAPRVWMPTISFWCGVALLAYFYWALRRHLKPAPWVAVAATAALALSPPYLVWTTGGLATMPLALLVFATFERAVLERAADKLWILAALPGVLLTLIRVEGIGWVAVIGVLTLLAYRRDGLSLRPVFTRFLGPVVAIYAGYFALRYAYFGALTPNATAAKLHFDALSLEAGASYVLSYHLALVTPVIAYLGGLWALRDGPRGFAVLTMAVAFPAYAVVVGGDYMTMGRLLVAGLPFTMWLLAYALNAAWARTRVLTVLTATAVVVVGVLPAFNTHLLPLEVRKSAQFRHKTAKFRSEYEQWEFMAKNTARWTRKGRALRYIAEPGESLATGGIGAVGYYSNLFIYDVGGLVNREVANRIRTSSKKKKSPGHVISVNREFFLKDKPTYWEVKIIDTEPFAPAIIRASRQWNPLKRVVKQYVPEFVELPGRPRAFAALLRRHKDGEEPPALQWSLFEQSVLDYFGGQGDTTGPTTAGWASRGDGRWHVFAPLTGLTEQQQAEIDALEAIGYVEGSEHVAFEDVTVHEPDRAQQGLNFYVSGHMPGAVLVDMDGNVLHQWQVSYADAFPDQPEKPKNRNTHFWRRATLLPNGDVIAIFEGLGILKVDAASNVIWAHHNKAHHDLQIMPDGDIVVLTREGKVIPAINETEPVLEDYVSVLGPDGVEKSRLSVLAAFLDSEYRNIFEQSKRQTGDLFHTNAVSVLDGTYVDKMPALAAGNLLVSMRVLDAIAIIDPSEQRVVWAHRGEFKKQHDPTLLDNGNMLLFDNLGAGGKSRVMEFDPVSLDTIWSYRASTFVTRTCGTAERLDNGNTLVIESARGRAFELTPENEVVWEFYIPHHTGDRGQFIATLFDVHRLPLDFPTDWAQNGAP